ncbi:hypothetical protein ABK040_002526 [Willaertia magna]
MSVLTQNVTEAKHHKSGQRLKIIKEILDTERNYIEELEILEEVYAKPLKELIGKQKFITQPLYNRLFKPDISIIRRTNTQLYEALKENYEMERSNKLPTKTYGQIFLEFAPFIKTYSRYFNEYDGINGTLEEVKKTNKLLQNWFDEQRTTAKAKNKPLQSLLITPVQRVPRYRLLLTEVVKYTSPYHRDYTLLNNALKEISEVASLLNSKMQESINRMKLYSISDNLKNMNNLLQFLPNNEFVQPSRIYCEEYLLNSVYSKKYHQCLNNCVLIILNNCFIITKIVINDKKKNLSIDLDNFNIEYNYENLEFIFEPIICDFKFIDKFNIPWIIDIPNEEENKVEDDTKTTINGNNNLLTVNTEDKEKNKNKLLMNDIYLFKNKPNIIQLISQNDIYTLQFNSLEEKYNCIKTLTDKIDENFKEIKNINDKENKRCIFKNYEKEGINEYLENKIFWNNNNNLTNMENNLFQWNYMTVKDIPKLKKKKLEEMEKIVTENVLQDFKLKFTNLEMIEKTAIGACYACCDFLTNINTDNNTTNVTTLSPNLDKYLLNFHMGDIFIFWQKIKKGKKFLICQKTGLNFNPLRKVQCLDDVLPKTLKEMKSVMRKQATLKKKKPKTPNQLLGIRDHYVKIEKELEAEKNFEELAVELDLLNVLSAFSGSSSASNGGNNSSKASKERKEYEKNLRKTLTPSLLNTVSDNYEQENPELLFFKHIFNVLSEKGEIGVVPTKAMVELPNQTFKTLLTLMEKRDMLEERKVRNFTIRKVSVNNSSNSTSTASGRSASVIGNSSNSNSNTSSNTSTPNTPVDESAKEEEKKKNRFSLFAKK